MGMLAAKRGDQIIAKDKHVVNIPSPRLPILHPFAGIIDGNLSQGVKIMGKPAAAVDSTASNNRLISRREDLFKKPG